MKTNNEWEKWGASDPYFGVLSNEKYRIKNLTNESKEEFFASGVSHVNFIFDLINKYFLVNLKPKTILDFGCGVGRLAIPFADHAENVLGVDISPSMLDHAKRNAKKKLIKNIDFVISDDALSNISGSYSLIHSYIVFQHIPKKRGHLIILNLAEKVEPEGFIAFHIFTESTASLPTKFLVRLRYRLPPIQWLWNFVKKRPLFEPPMQLNCYDSKYLSENLAAIGFSELRFIDVPSIPGFKGVLLVARRV